MPTAQRLHPCHNGSINGTGRPFLARLRRDLPVCCERLAGGRAAGLALCALSCQSNPSRNWMESLHTRPHSPPDKAANGHEGPGSGSVPLRDPNRCRFLRLGGQGPPQHGAGGVHAADARGLA